MTYRTKAASAANTYLAEPLAYRAGERRKIKRTSARAERRAARAEARREAED